MDNETFANVTTIPIEVVMAPFDTGQKVVYVFSSALCALFGYIIYRLLKHGIDDDENYPQRMEWLYAMCTGALIGTVLADAIPHAGLHSELGVSTGYTSYAVTCFGIAIGLLTMILLEKLSRVWHSNAHYQMPSTIAENQQNLLDPKTLVGNTHMVFTDDLTSELFGARFVTNMDVAKDWEKRVLFSSILYVCMLYIAMMDGLFIVYWSSRSAAGLWVMVALSWVTRLLQSSIVYCALFHGMAGSRVLDRWWKYLFKYGTMAFVWFATLVCATIPVLSDMSVESATYFIERIPLSFFSGIVAGVLFWQATYFYWMHPDSCTRASERRSFIILASVTLLLCLTGLFI